MTISPALKKFDADDLSNTNYFIINLIIIIFFSQKYKKAKNKKKKKLTMASLELAASSLLGKRDNPYTTRSTSNIIINKYNYHVRSIMETL